MEKMDHRQFGIQFLEMARNVSYLFIYFFFLYFISFVRMIIEPVQAYSVIRNNVVETNGGQARIRLVYVEQLSSGHFYSACGRRGITDVVYTVDRRSNKTISRQKLVKWKIILVFFRLVSFSFFRWNTSNSWNFNDRCATAQLSRAQTVDNSQLTHILCLVPVAESWQRQRERERRNVVNRNNYFNLLSTASPLSTREEYLVQYSARIFLHDPFPYSNNSNKVWNKCFLIKYTRLLLLLKFYNVIFKRNEVNSCYKSFKSVTSI